MFSLDKLFIIGLQWFELILSNFQITEILLRRFLNTRFHCGHLLLLVCYDSSLFSAIFRKLRFSWEEFRTLDFIAYTFYYWSDMIQASSQQFSENWDFAEKSFEHTFSSQTLLIIGLLWFRVVLSWYSECWEEFWTHIFFIPSNFYYWSILILGLSQQFSASWDFAETTL